MREEDKKRIEERIEALLEEKKSGVPGARVIIAIDGGSASGKTTLAGELAEKYDGSLFHMDDFYPQTYQRTPERYEEPGGNVDRERFMEEVLIPLRQGESEILYRPFDCGTMSVTPGNTVDVKPLCIVEGAYSTHPEMEDAYDLKVFLNVDPKLQMDRISIRNTPEQQKAFRGKWIPLEEKYFAAFDIKEKAHMVIEVEEEK